MLVFPLVPASPADWRWRGGDVAKGGDRWRFLSDRDDRARSEWCAGTGIFPLRRIRTGGEQRWQYSESLEGADIADGWVDASGDGFWGRQRSVAGSGIFHLGFLKW